MWGQRSSYLCTERCRRSLSLHISDQAGTDATECMKEERKREKERTEWDEKTHWQQVESIRWAEIVYHCLQATLWHCLCYWSVQHHRIDLMLGTCINTLEKRERAEKGTEENRVVHEQRTRNVTPWGVRQGGWNQQNTSRYKKRK